MGAAEPSEQELEELRRHLRAHAAASFQPADADDAVQTALLRVVADERPSNLPVRQRAFRKLKDVRAEIFRRPQRTFEVAAEPLDDQAELAREDPALAIFEMADLVESVLGPDVLAYAKQKAVGCSDADVVEELGWTSQRVDAARKKLSRNASRLATLINETLS